MEIAPLTIAQVAPLSRRSFVLSAVAASVLAACGNDDSQPEVRSLDVEGSNGPLALAAAFQQTGVWVAGIEQRLPFVLVDNVGPILEDEAPDSIDIEVRRDGEIVSSATLSRGQLAIPFFALTATFDTPGVYEAYLVGSDSPAAFQVHERSEIALVQVGDPIRSAVTPTFDNAQDVEPICTRTPDFCPWHDETLAAVMEAGRPVALLISTPGFCQTDVCGPVLELLTVAAVDYPDVAIVHAEVYAFPAEINQVAEPEVTSAVSTYQLSYEPSLIVADASGSVTARLDFTFDEAEIRTALSTAV